MDCPGCKTPLFIQMDGSVESMAGASGEREKTKSGVHETRSQQTQSAHMDLSEMLVDEAMSPGSQPAAPQPLPDEVVEGSMGMAEAPSGPIVGVDDEPAIPPPLPEEPPSQPEMAEASDVDSFFDEPEQPALNAVPLPPISDMSSLANETGAQTGSLRYTILIAGIDTAEIRSEFRDLISDRRFLWDVEGILRSITSGKVRVRDVTAVKAILLIHRLRSLPVHVQWEQHVVHQV